MTAKNKFVRPLPELIAALEAVQIAWSSGLFGYREKQRLMWEAAEQIKSMEAEIAALKEALK